MRVALLGSVDSLLVHQELQLQFELLKWHRGLSSLASSGPKYQSHPVDKAFGKHDPTDPKYLWAIYDGSLSASELD